MCTPGQLFIQNRNAPVQLCLYAEFGVASSKIRRLGGYQVNKVFPLWHLLPLPLSTGSLHGTRPPMVALAHKV